MTSGIIIVAFLVNLLKITNGQECLADPPVLEWVLSDGIYAATLTFNSKHFDGSTYGYPRSFTTRVHNGLLPSPTLRFERGQTYKVTLVNELDPVLNDPNNPTEYNVIKDLNVTNIHTHGVHISGESPADNVFNHIDGGSSMEYTYNIPCNHAGGTFWHHPHHHGSTAIQVGGGAVGTIIVEDSKDEEGFPEWLKNMDVQILVIQHIDLAFVISLGNGIDNVFDADNAIDFWLLNGKYLPSICLETGVWKRLRIVHADILNENEFTIDEMGGSSSNCEVYLISKDGVLIHDNDNTVPREIVTRKLYFSVASRADVAVRCNQAGTYTFYTNENELIANFVVTDPVNGPAANIELTSFNPIRPEYLHSLLTNPGPYQQETFLLSRMMMMDHRVTINGELFSGQDDYMVQSPINSLQEWTLDAGIHPMHVHVNHFQLKSGGLTGTDPNWSKIGDWLDTVDADATVRFKTHTFGGHVVLHCHILHHEDEGTMAVAYINGGCDATGTQHIDASDSCISVNCNQPFWNPTATTTTTTTPGTTTTATTTCKTESQSCWSDSECCETLICRMRRCRESGGGGMGGGMMAKSAVGKYDGNKDNNNNVYIISASYASIWIMVGLVGLTILLFSITVINCCEKRMCYKQYAQRFLGDANME